MGGSSKQILLIEDDEENANVLEAKVKLCSRDYRVLKANRLLPALRLIKQGEIDVVLLDLGLPDSHGWESVERVLEAIRAHSPTTALILLTGNSDDQLALKAIRCGAQDYIFKPELNQKTLGRAISFALERVQITDALKEANNTLEAALRERSDKLKDALAFIGKISEVEKERREQALKGQIERELEMLQNALTFASEEDEAQREQHCLLARKAADSLRQCVNRLLQKEAPTSVSWFRLALLSFLHEYQKQVSFDISLQQEGVDGLDGKLALISNALGVISDALSHLEHNTQAERVEISLIGLPERLTILITESSDRLSPQYQTSRVDSEDLARLRTRALLANGLCRVETAEELGLAVSVHLPLVNTAEWQALSDAIAA
jgi:DNA-binding response OmpR family regulator